jgi:hypothetical protein
VEINSLTSHLISAVETTNQKKKQGGKTPQYWADYSIHKTVYSYKKSSGGHQAKRRKEEKTY